MDKRKGLIAAYRKWGPTTKFFALLAVLGVIFTCIFGFKQIFIRKVNNERPLLTLNSVKFEGGDAVKFLKKDNILKIRTQTEIKNIGKIIASSITYPKATLKIEVLGKDVSVEVQPPPGTPLSLAPGINYYYGVNADITFLKIEQMEKFITDFQQNNGVPVLIDIIVKYSDKTTFKEYTSSASFRLTRKNSYILKSNIE